MRLQHVDAALKGLVDVPMLSVGRVCLWREGRGLPVRVVGCWRSRPQVPPGPRIKVSGDVGKINGIVVGLEQETIKLVDALHTSGQEPGSQDSSQEVAA